MVTLVAMSVVYVHAHAPVLLLRNKQDQTIDHHIVRATRSFRLPKALQRYCMSYHSSSLSGRGSFFGSIIFFDSLFSFCCRRVTYIKSEILHTLTRVPDNTSKVKQSFARSNLAI